MSELYKVDNLGELRSWRIGVSGNKIIISYGQLQGKKIHQEETIETGLAGRSLEQQMESRVNSRINRQKDRGYRDTIKEALLNKSKNSLNTYAPMLAQRFDKVKSPDMKRAMVQRKLDGNRMLVTKQDGDIIAYTRNGKPINTLCHILNDLNLEEGQTVDGEVYIHGAELKDINSLIRKSQPDTVNLKYHIYDVVESEPYCKRYAVLKEIKKGDSVIVEPAWEYDQSTIHREFREVRADGYEGLMIRLHGKGYEPGSRARQLLKMKSRHDEEFRVTGVEVAKNGTGILVLELDNLDTFKAVAPGTMKDKIHVADNPEGYIGKNVTVSYAYLTTYGIPFHAVCERWFEEI